ncbi:MAG: DNA polymerase III subunit delta, partial [Pontixanthobacter sp.]
GDITTSVRRMADAAGLRLDGDLAQRIAQGAGLDIRLAASEVEKLALYADADPQAPRPVDATMLAEIAATTEDDGFMGIVNAVLSGDTRKLPGELARMRELSINPVGLLLAFERRVAQLTQLSERIGPDGNVGRAVEAEKRARRIFWKDEGDIVAQLGRWRGRRLDRLNTKLIDLHRAVIGNSRAGEVLLAQGLAEIARHAAQRR